MSTITKILHKKSAVKDRAPEASALDYGEIAINYAKGSESIYIKNSDNEVVSIKSGGGGTSESAAFILTENGGAQMNGCSAIGSNAVAEGYYTTASGNYSHAEGTDTTASGARSHAEGYYTTASGTYSHAEGAGTTASGSASHAEGSGTTASGICSHAEGRGTKADGEYSHTEGSGTTASGSYSHAEGRGTTASGSSSHAEGSGTTASGLYSHAEGFGTIASGYYGSHAEGNNTTASGTSSHAEGSGTTASGAYSHAEGYGTSATTQSEHASGRYNISLETSGVWGNSGNTLFTVGNGNPDNTHNALQIMQDGTIYISDTSASGEYYQKPMIKLQDALKNSGNGGGSGSIDTSDFVTKKEYTYDPMGPLTIDLEDGFEILMPSVDKSIYASRKNLYLKNNEPYSLTKILTNGSEAELDKLSVSGELTFNDKITSIKSGVAALSLVNTIESTNIGLTLRSANLGNNIGSAIQITPLGTSFLYGANNDTVGIIASSGTFTAKKIRVSGGTSTQVMMADGSVREESTFGGSGSGSVDTSNLVTTNTAQDISGEKTFTNTVNVTSGILQVGRPSGGHLGLGIDGAGMSVNETNQDLYFYLPNETFSDGTAFRWGIRQNSVYKELMSLDDYGQLKVSKSINFTNEEGAINNVNEINFANNDGHTAKIKISKPDGDLSIDTNVDIKGNIYTTKKLSVFGDVSFYDGQIMSEQGMFRIKGDSTDDSSLDFSTMYHDMTINAHSDGENSFLVICSDNTIMLQADTHIQASKNIEVTSDETLKTDIDNIALSVEDIANVRSISFKYKGNENGKVHVGTIAQDWQKILPQSVTEGRDGTLSLDYSGANMVASISLAKKVVEQEERIKKLEEMIERLLEKE